MAANIAMSDCFSIGSIVACTTCFDQVVEGEVLAFDQPTRMLILKCRSKKADELHDVYIINLKLCSNVALKEEITVTEGPQHPNISRLKNKLDNTVLQRQKWFSTINTGVSPEGQNLYMAVAKRFDPKSVAWEGSNIVIMKEVTISPPYRADNITTSNSNQQGQNLLNYARKMVEHYFKNQAATASSHVAESSTATNAITPTVGTSSNASASPVPAN